MRIIELRNRGPRLAVLAVLAAVLAACGSPTPQADGGAPTAPAADGGDPLGDPDGPTEPEDEASAVLSWREDLGEVALADGHRIARCEGDAPLWCVSRDGQVLGVVELLRQPLEGEVDPEQRLAELHATVRADRAATCGTEGRGYEADPVRSAIVAGHDGVRGGFATTAPDGTVDERTAVWMAVADDALLVVNAGAYRPAGCPGSGEGQQEMAPEVLEAVLPALDDLVAASTGVQGAP